MLKKIALMLFVVFLAGCLTTEPVKKQRPYDPDEEWIYIV